MSRKKKSDVLEEDEPILDISSLIDVCFLLLIYFIVTTTIQAREQDLGLQIPGTAEASSDVPTIPPMFIKLDSSGQVYVNTGPAQEKVEEADSGRQLTELSRRLADFSASTTAAAQEPLVQVYVDGEAQQQRVIDVINSIAGAKIGNVAFTDLLDDE